MSDQHPELCTSCTDSSGKLSATKIEEMFNSPSALRAIRAERAAKRVGLVLLLLTLAKVAIGCAGIPKASPADAKGPETRESKRVSFTQASKDSREFDHFEANEWYLDIPRRGDDQGKYQHLNGGQVWCVASTLTWKWSRVFPADTIEEARAAANGALTEFQLNDAEIARLHGEIFSIVAQESAPWVDHSLSFKINMIGWRVKGEAWVVDVDESGNPLVFEEGRYVGDEEMRLKAINGLSHKSRYESEIKNVIIDTRKPAVAISLRLEVRAGISYGWNVAHTWGSTRAWGEKRTPRAGEEPFDHSEKRDD